MLNFQQRLFFASRLNKMFSKPTIKENLHVAMISVHGNPLVPEHELGSDGKGGQNVYVREVGQQLSKLQCDVTWFTRSESPKEVGCVEISTSLRCEYIVAGPQVHINRDFLFPYLDEFTKSIDGSKFDVIFTNYWLSGYVGLRLRQIYNIPQCHVHHSLGELKYKHLDMPDIGPKRLQVEKQINKCVDCMIHQTKAEWVLCKATNPFLIRPGINIERFEELDRTTASAQLEFDNDVINVLYAGRIAPQKGLSFAIEALKGSRIPHTFRIIGAFKKSGIDETNVDPRVQFLGSKTQNELALYMAASDVLVIPSLYEPFGIVAIEGMAAGCCLIVSATGGLDEIVKHGVNGLKVPPGDSNAIREAFEKIASDPLLRNNVKVSNIEESAMYNWRNTANQIRRLLSRISL